MTGKSVLITGCSSGIGYSAAHLLQRRGWRVFAAVRKADDRQRLEAEGLETVRLDYTDPVSITFSLDRVLARTGGGLDALCNNGAFCQLGALEDLSTELLRRQFEANVFGWHELTRRVVPVMRRQGGGRIVQISSVLGYVAGKYRGAYTASKYALEGLTDVLRLELKGSGIAVVLIEPGPIETALPEGAVAHFATTVDAAASVHAEAYRQRLERLAAGGRASRITRRPEAVANAIVAALEAPRPKLRYRVTLPARAAWYLRRFLTTRMLDRVMARQ